MPRSFKERKKKRMKTVDDDPYKRYLDSTSQHRERFTQLMDQIDGSKKITQTHREMDQIDTNLGEFQILGPWIFFFRSISLKIRLNLLLRRTRLYLIHKQYTQRHNQQNGGARNRSTHSTHRAKNQTKQVFLSDMFSFNRINSAYFFSTDRFRHPSSSCSPRQTRAPLL